MALASSAVPWSAAKAVAESARTAADAAATMKLRIMHFLPVRTCRAGSVHTCKMAAALPVVLPLSARSLSKIAHADRLSRSWRLAEVAALPTSPIYEYEPERSSPPISSPSPDHVYSPLQFLLQVDDVHLVRDPISVADALHLTVLNQLFQSPHCGDARRLQRVGDLTGANGPEVFNGWPCDKRGLCATTVRRAECSTNRTCSSGPP